MNDHRSPESAVSGAKKLLEDVLQQNEGVKPERGRDGNQETGKVANGSPRMNNQE